MRRILFAFALACGSSFFASAQSVQVESFDRGGLPARAQTAEERELMQRMSAHRRGDVADAAEIQRGLARYYRSKGDEQRARIAEERANASGELYKTPAAARPYDPAQMPQYGTAPDPAYRAPQGRRPNYDAPQMPGYGSMPMPVYGTMPPRKSSEPDRPMLGAPVRPAPGEATPPPAGSAIPIYQPETPSPDNPADARPETGTAAPSPAVEPPPDVPQQAAGAPPAAPQPAGFSGRYFVMQAGMLHTWEFRPDGTFEHVWSGAGADPSAANFEAGRFQMAGPYLTLFVMRGSTRGGPIAARRANRRMPFQMRGAGGRDGIVLDGMMLQPKP